MGVAKSRGSQFPVRHDVETQARCVTCQASDFPLPESEAGRVRLPRPGQVHVRESVAEAGAQV